MGCKDSKAKIKTVKSLNLVNRRITPTAGDVLFITD